MAAPYLDPLEGLPGAEPVVAQGPVGPLFLTLEELEALPDPEWCVEGILPADSLVCLFGRPGTFKTFLAISIGLHLAAGRPWFGRRVKAGAVLFVAAEGGRGIKKRLRAARKRFNIGAVPFLVLPRAFSLTDLSMSTAVLNEIEEYCPALVVLDTYTRLTPGLDTSSQRDFGDVLPILDRFRQRTGSTVLVVDHSNKVEGKGSSGITGTIAKPGAYDAVLSLRREAKALSVTLTVEKMKDFEEAAPIELDLIEVGDSLVMVLPDTPNYCQKDVAVLESLAAIVDDSSGATATAWRQSADLPERTFHRKRADLVRANLVAKRGSKYLLTAGGTALLEGRGLLPQLPSNCQPPFGSAPTTAANSPSLIREGSGSGSQGRVAA